MKLKSCKELSPWITSITNYMWWWCATCNKDYILLKEKWISALFNISNFHSWSTFRLFLSYQHCKFINEQVLRNLWSKQLSPAFKVLDSGIKDMSTLNDLSFSTEFQETEDLDFYHLLINKYCPKRQAFSF